MTKSGRCIWSYQFKLLFIGKRTPQLEADTCDRWLCTFAVWLNEILIDLRHVELTGGSCVEFPKLAVAFQTCFISVSGHSLASQKICVRQRMAFPPNNIESFKKKLILKLFKNVFTCSRVLEVVFWIHTIGFQVAWQKLASLLLLLFLSRFNKLKTISSFANSSACFCQHRC